MRRFGQTSSRRQLSKINIFPIENLFYQFFGREGIPLPSKISVEGFPKEDNTDASDSWDEKNPAGRVSLSCQ